LESFSLGGQRPKETTSVEGGLNHLGELGVLGCPSDDHPVEVVRPG